MSLKSAWHLFYKARYTHGVGIDEPLMMERDTNANQTFEANERFFYHSDGLGSVTDLTDTAGALAQSYVYDSFGNIAVQAGTLPNPYTYTARELDPESGLFYYRARYYDPRIGRFLSEDPIGFAGGDVNLYSYTFNNPTNYVDPLGLQSVLEEITVPIIIITVPLLIYEVYRKNGLNKGAPHPPLRPGGPWPPSPLNPYEKYSPMNPFSWKPGGFPKLPPWMIPLPLVPAAVKEYCRYNPSANICDEVNPDLQPEEEYPPINFPPCPIGARPLPPFADRA